MLSTAAYCSEKSDSKKAENRMQGLCDLKIRDLPTAAELHFDDDRLYLLANVAFSRRHGECHEFIKTTARRCHSILRHAGQKSRR